MRKLSTGRAVKQAGFTLIELIIVIVLIGILAAVAIPKFVNLSTEAEQGVMKAIGGSVSSASAINYARKSGGVGGIAVSGTAGAVAVALTSLSEIPSGYTVTGCANIVTTGIAGTCNITKTGQVDVSFSAYGAP